MYAKYMKKCNICLIEKPFNEFQKRGQGIGPYCYICKREYDKKYWQKTKEKRNIQKKINIKLIKKRNKEFIWKYLELNSCKDCNESDIEVLQFDHIFDKQYNIAEMLTHSLKNLQLEIEKCEVRCANCHQRKTAKENNWYNYI